MLLTNRSWTYHYIYDVTMTSCYMGLTPDFNTTSAIYVDICVYQVSHFYSFALPRYRKEENGGKNMFPSGWRFLFVLCALRPSIHFICIGLALNFCGMYGGRRWVGLPTSRARARVRRLTPTDRYPRDPNPGPLDLSPASYP